MLVLVAALLENRVVSAAESLFQDEGRWGPAADFYIVVCNLSLGVRPNRWHFAASVKYALSVAEAAKITEIGVRAVEAPPNYGIAAEYQPMRGPGTCCRAGRVGPSTEFGRTWPARKFCPIVRDVVLFEVDQTFAASTQTAPAPVGHTDCQFIESTHRAVGRN